MQQNLSIGFWFFLGLFGLLSSWSCGPQDSEQRDPPNPPVLPLITSRDTPVVYNLADSACQNRIELVDSPLTLTETWVTTTSGLDLLQQQVALVETQTRASLQNDAVASTTYGEAYERVCDFRKPKQTRCTDDNGREIPFYRQGSKGPLPLKICKDRYQYPADTYEGVAITAAYHLAQTRQFYRKAVTEGPQLPKVSLSVFPTFEESYDYFPQFNKSPGRLVTYITHNLAYFSEIEEVVVFPETVTSTAKNKLWESPFVLSHEYGHHIDNIRHKKNYSQAAVTWDARSHRFTDLHQGTESIVSGHLATVLGTKPLLMSAKALLATAVGEAFADLIAYYTQGESSASILTFEEIGTDRDVKNPRFLNGLDKTLKQDYVTTFFDQFEAKPKDADLAQMTGVHAIGAVLAYGANQVFSSLTNDTTDTNDTNSSQTLAKYRLLLTFMDTFTTALTQLNSQSSSTEALTTLAKALQAAIDQGLPGLRARVASDQWKDTKLKLCEILARTFPALEDGAIKVESPC